MKTETLLELLDGGILAKYVQADDFPQYGGIVLTKPPGSLGSTCIEIAAKAHSDVLCLSDLTLPSFKVMRDDFISGRYSGLSLLEMDKIYARQHTTAMNLEGLLKGLTEEGFRHFATEDQRMASMPCRAHIQGAATTALVRKNNERWMENGFARRFLWVTFRMRDVGQIGNAVHQWKRFDMGTVISKRPGNGRIPYDLTPQMSNKIRLMVKEQPGGNATAYVLLKKIACVWQWKFKDEKRVDFLLRDVERALTKDGDWLDLDEHKNGRHS